MKRLLWPLVLLVALVAGGSAYHFARQRLVPSFHATEYAPPEPAADFALTAHTGETVRMSDLRGTPVLLFFGFTHCPDVCPLTLTTLRSTLQSMGAGPDDVRVVLVTVDPARDTPEALARYLDAFPGVLGLTGPPETLREAYRAYGVGAQSVPGAHDHGQVIHTSGVYGIDSEGDIRVLLRPTAPSEALTSDLRTLLRL